MTVVSDLSVVYDRDAIAARVQTLGNEIAADFPEGNIACVGVLPNSMVFMADLIRAIDSTLTCDFIKVGTEDSRRVDIAFGQANDFSSRDVLLIQGVVDTGVTLSFITGHIQETWKPRTLKVAALINRENHRKVDCPVDYKPASSSPKEGFVAGYGLGFHEQLPRGSLPRASEQVEHHDADNFHA